MDLPPFWRLRWRAHNLVRQHARLRAVGKG
jgi:hypothetical protein